MLYTVCKIERFVLTIIKRRLLLLQPLSVSFGKVIAEMTPFNGEYTGFYRAACNADAV